MNHMRSAVSFSVSTYICHTHPHAAVPRQSMSIIDHYRMT